MASQPIAGVTAPGGNWRTTRRLQWAITAVLVMIFIWVAIDRIWPLRIVAEQTGIEHNLGAIRTALANALVEKALNPGGLSALAELDHANPMALLDPAPSNYEVMEHATDATDLVPYRWYFFLDQGVLAYKVGNPEYVRVENDGNLPLLRFQVQVGFTDADGNGRYEHGTDLLRGISLVTLDAYQWLPVK